MKVDTELLTDLYGSDRDLLSVSVKRRVEVQVADAIGNWFEREAKRLNTSYQKSGDLRSVQACITARTSLRQGE
jgi:hypothetical protein